MIDLDIILEASEEKRGTKMWLECGNLSYCDINELILRLSQAEKDAERYRFMRDMSDGVDVSRFFHIEVSERDAEIDGDMQCNK